MKNLELAELYMPMAEGMARSRSRSLPANATFDEVRSAAYYGLSDAAHRYDPSRGVPFPAYARIRIAGEICEFFRGLSYSNSEPEDIASREPSCALETEDFFEFACSELGEREGKLLRMYYLEERSLKEVGEALGVTESRASQMLKDCRVRLGRRLKKGVLA